MDLAMEVRYDFCALYLKHLHLTELLRSVLATYGLWWGHRLALKYQKTALDAW